LKQVFKLKQLPR